jgi:TPR repeat protein
MKFSVLIILLFWTQVFGQSESSDKFQQAQRSADKEAIEMENYFKKAQFNKIKKLADAGSSSAQTKLGDYYAEGFGVTEDDSEAVKWYRKAAAQDDAQAYHNLGFCYFVGKGVVKNYSEAIKCGRKAAALGLVQAQNNLGVVYETGDIVAKDYVEAYAYYNVAAVDFEGARASRDKLEKQMTPSQIEAGQKRSKELQKEIEANIAAKGEKK